MRVSNEGYPHAWQSCKVSFYEGNQSRMMDFHSHVYYEISLILSGDVKSLLLDHAVEGTESRLVLTAPRTPHWMYLARPSLYSRINLCFSKEFLVDYVPEWNTLAEVFGANGTIVLLSDSQCDFFRELLLTIQREPSAFRQRLRILELLSYVSECEPCARESLASPPPSYVIDALSYIGEHYSERLVAQELAWRFGVGRTTLMTSFHRYVGATLSEYITQARVKQAILLLETGLSQELVAERVGLGSGSGLIRAFRHCYGMTPRQYMKSRYRQNSSR